jgi:hypothetical protein
MNNCSHTLKKNRRFYVAHSEINLSKFISSIENVMVTGENLNVTTNILQVSTLCATWLGCSSQCVIQFLNAESTVPIETHQHLRNIYGDMAVNVSTVRCVGYGGSGLKDTSCSGCPCTAVTAESEERVQLIRDD